MKRPGMKKNTLYVQGLSQQLLTNSDDFLTLKFSEFVIYT